MLKVPFLKADLSRLASTGTFLTIGKFLPILIAPILLLWGYGKVQAVQREVAEQRVEQLTSDVQILSRSLAQVEKYNADRQVRITDYANDTRVINHEESEVLDLPAPLSVVDVLRPYPGDTTE